MPRTPRLGPPSPEPGELSEVRPGRLVINYPLVRSFGQWSVDGHPPTVKQEDNEHLFPYRNVGYYALAIETSCDDTSVAIIHVRRPEFFEHEIGQIERGTDDRHLTDEHLGVKVLFHEKVTANNDAYAGIHPLIALESHRTHLAPLLRKAWRAASSAVAHETDGRVPIDVACTPLPLQFVAVTRGPGMRSNLAVGLDTAKGVAAILGVPLIGVHHMQAHALTPRLLTAIDNWRPDFPSETEVSNVDGPIQRTEPAFPFLTVLVSGGHTMLLNSTSLTEHRTLAETQDIAIGDFLDKAARAILPAALLRPPYGRALEQFAFSTQVIEASDGDGGIDVPDTGFPIGADFIAPHKTTYDYTPPLKRQDELAKRPTKWGWSLSPPLAESKGGEKSSRRMVYSFAGLLTSIERLVHRPDPFSLRERQDLAREVQRVAFEHLASRILLHLESSTTFTGDTVVVSGGVASNSFLRHVLRRILDVRGYERIKLCFPPIELCTDNALMIAWAAVEMYEAGHMSSLDIGPIRKWSMDPTSADGGILGADGWIKRNDEWDASASSFYGKDDSRGNAEIFIMANDR